MSLINDALKKAQKQRTGEAPMLASLPGVGGESAARIARRSKSGGPNSMLIWAGAGAGVLLLLGGYFALRPSPVAAPLPPAQMPPVAVNSTPPPAIKPSAPDPEASAPVTFALPIAPAPKTETPAKTEDKEPRVAAAQAPDSSPAAKPQDEPRRLASPKPDAGGSSGSAGGPPAAPARPAPAPKLETRALTFIESIRVAGIRASATDSKVLMNDRVYRIGDTVEHEMGLRLVGITANSLTFEDERGGRFTRTF